MLTFLLLTMASLVAAGLLWAILVESSRHGRSSSDPDKEIPDNRYIHVECRHCGFRWFRLPEDHRPCPACDDTGVRQ